MARNKNKNKNQYQTQSTVHNARVETAKEANRYGRCGLDTGTDNAFTTWFPCQQTLELKR